MQSTPHIMYLYNKNPMDFDFQKNYKSQTKIDCKIHQMLSDTNINDYEVTWHFKSLF